LLRDVPAKASPPAGTEEIFDPVLSAMAFDDEDHAAQLHNLFRLGHLDPRWRAPVPHGAAREIGQIFINNYGGSASSL
jgi:aldehyde dehydrogenase (NAD+)